MQVDLVTVNYNSHDATNEMLESLYNNTKFIDNIIIVDNKSSDKNVLELERNIALLDKIIKDKIILIKSDINLGYFGGLNKGLSLIKNKSDRKFIIVGNNDLIYKDSFFRELSTVYINSGVMVIAPNIKTVDGVYQNPHFISQPSKMRRFFYDLYFTNYVLGQLMLKVKRLSVGKRKVKKAQERQEIFMGIGACYILTSEFFNVYDSLDDKVFLWGEEAILSHQIHIANGKIEYHPNLKIKHMESVSTKKLTSRKKYNITKRSYKIYRDYLGVKKDI